MVSSIKLQDNDTYKNTDQKYWEEMIKEVDKNGDGEVYFFYSVNSHKFRLTIMNFWK